jgi:hypothetical protein
MYVFMSLFVGCVKDHTKDLCNFYFEALHYGGINAACGTGVQRCFTTYATFLFFCLAWVAIALQHWYTTMAFTSRRLLTHYYEGPISSVLLI